MQLGWFLGLDEIAALPSGCIHVCQKGSLLLHMRLVFQPDNLDDVAIKDLYAGAWRSQEGGAQGYTVSRKLLLLPEDDSVDDDGQSNDDDTVHHAGDIEVTYQWKAPWLIPLEHAESHLCSSYGIAQQILHLHGITSCWHAQKNPGASGGPIVRSLSGASTVSQLHGCWDCHIAAL